MIDNDNDNNYIKRDVGSYPTGILNNFLSRNYCDNDESGDFIGKVIDNNDPLKLGRCRILVYNVFNNSIPTEHLPWAVPEFSFVGSLKGSFIVPQIGAIVKVTFENDEINLPKYSSKVLNTGQLPTNKDKNYPDNMVFFETDAGDSFEVDRSTSEVVFTHNTGTKISIQSDGSIDIHSSKKINVTHGDNLFVDGSTVIPEAVGPLCALSNCLFTGAAHTGRTCKPTTPVATNSTVATETTQEG